MPCCSCVSSPCPTPRIATPAWSTPGCAATPADIAAVTARQVFRAHQCELRPWDAAGFAGCLAGRRLIMVGDSLMRQSFQSLGCLAAPVTASGVSADWRGKDTVPAPNPNPDADDPNSEDPAEEAVVIEPPTERRAYGVRADDGTIINATADWFGNFTLNNGAQVRGPAKHRNLTGTWFKALVLDRRSSSPSLHVVHLQA